MSFLWANHQRQSTEQNTKWPGLKELPPRWLCIDSTWIQLTTNVPGILQLSLIMNSWMSKRLKRCHSRHILLSSGLPDATFLGHLECSHIQTRISGTCAFAFAGPTVRNSSSYNLCNSTVALNQFWHDLLMHLMANQQCTATERCSDNWRKGRKKQGVAKLTSNPRVNGIDKILLETVIEAMNWLWESSSIDSVYWLCDCVGKQLNSRTSKQLLRHFGTVTHISPITLTLDTKSTNAKLTEVKYTKAKIDCLNTGQPVDVGDKMTNSSLICDITKWHKLTQTVGRQSWATAVQHRIFYVKAGNASLWATMISIQHWRGVYANLVPFEPAAAPAGFHWVCQEVVQLSCTKNLEQHTRQY